MPRTPEQEARLAELREEKAAWLAAQQPPPPVPTPAPQTAGADDVNLKFSPAPPPQAPAPTPAPNPQPVAGDDGEYPYREKYEALPDWLLMPELRSASMSTPLAWLGTLNTGPAETKKIIEAQFPKVKARQDGKYIVFTSEDGNEYAWKPGFRWSDAVRAAGGLGLGVAATAGAAAAAPAALTAALPGGLAGGILTGMAAGGGTAAISEGLEALAGGDFNPGQVALSTGVGAALPLAGKIARTVKETFLPSPATRAAAAAPAAAAAAAPADDAVTTMTRTALGDEEAGRELARMVEPDFGRLAAADRTGTRDLLDAAAVSKSPAFVEAHQGAASFTGSPLKQRQLQNIEEFGNKTVEMLEGWGANMDRGAQSAIVRDKMAKRIETLADQAEQVYSGLNKVMGRAEVSPDSTLAFIEDLASKERDGIAGLPSWIRKIYKDLKPRQKSSGGGGEPKWDAARQMMVNDVETVTAEFPTYTTLDGIRKRVGAASRAKGTMQPFKDPDRGLAKKMYEMLEADQLQAAAEHGQDAALSAAQALVKTRKMVEKKVAKLFGDQLSGVIEGSMVETVDRALNAAARGNDAAVGQLMGNVPKSMRADVAATGLVTALGKTAPGKPIDLAHFVKFANALDRNPTAKASVFNPLGQAATERWNDIASVARGLLQAQRALINNGKLQTIKDVRGADGVVNALVDAAIGIGDRVSRRFGGLGRLATAGLADDLQHKNVAAVTQFLMAPEAKLLMEGVAAKSPVPPQLYQRIVTSKPYRRLMAAANVPEGEGEMWLRRVVTQSTRQVAQQTDDSQPEEAQ